MNQSPRRRPAWLRRLPTIPRRYAILLVMASAFALAFFQRMGLAAIAHDLMAEFHLDAGQIGALGSYYFYPYALLQIPVGLMVDRWGARRLALVFLSIGTIGSLIFALALTVPWLMMGRILVGVGAAGLFIPSLKLISVWFPAKDLATWNGIFQALSSCGMLLAGRPLVEMSGRFGWSRTFLIAAILTGVVLVCVWLIVREEPRPDQRPHSTLVSKPRAGMPLRWSRIWRSPFLWMMGTAGFLMVGAHAGFQAIWAGPYLLDVYHLTPAAVGNLLMLMPIGSILGNLIIGSVADRLFRSRVIAALAGCGAYAACWLPLALRTDSIGVAGLSALYLGLGFLYTSFLLVFPLVRTEFTAGVASTATGAVNLMIMLGGAGFQQAFGALLNRFTPTAAGYSAEAYILAFRAGATMVVLGWAILLAGLRLYTIRQRTPNR